MKLRVCLTSKWLWIRNLKFGKSITVAEGLIEGEKKKSMEIAHKLHHLGLSAEQISDITGCSSLEIKKSDQN